MFTTFPAHKKRPAAGAGTHIHPDAAEKRFDSVCRAVFPAVVPGYYTSLCHACPYKYQFFHLLSGFCTDFDRLFGQILVFCRSRKRQKKLPAQLGRQLFVKAKDKSALAELEELGAAPAKQPVISSPSS